MIRQLLLAAISLGILLSGSAGAEDFTHMLTRGKVDSELGKLEEAAKVFREIADNSAAPAPLRWEALVRVGIVHRVAGDAALSVEAFKRVESDFSEDRDAMKFLVEGVTGIIATPAQWSAVYPHVRLRIDESRPGGPIADIDWPGLNDCFLPAEPDDVRITKIENMPIKVFAHLIQTETGVTIEIDPCAEFATVEASAMHLPRDIVFRAALGVQGLLCELEGRTYHITCRQSANTNAKTVASGNVLVSFGLPVDDVDLCGSDAVLVSLEHVPPGERAAKIAEALDGVADGTTVDVCGVAPAVPDVANLVGSMEERARFGDVDLKFMQLQGAGFVFHMKAVFRP